MNGTSPRYWIAIPMILLALTAFACPAFSENVSALIRKAEKGDPEAQYTLGNAYYSGTMIERNHAEAVKWYRKAAEQGDPDAPVMLAIAYEMGCGVPMDDMQSYVWYSIAASRRPGADYVNYARWRDEAAGKLTPDQRVKADQMIREWEAKRPRN